jgi:hypothetical protein
MFISRMAKKLAVKAFPQIADFGVRLRAIESAFLVLATSSKYENDESAFNQQVVRRDTTTKVLSAMKPSTIVETGTFLGNTTGYLAKFGVPVISAEISAPLFFAAKQRLSDLSNISLRLCDSRELLRQLISEGVNGSPTFFYLDAHWLDDLPLRDEIETIYESWESCIILIDDFKVANDSGYGYDNYGGKKILNYAYIKRYLEGKPIGVFFPNTPSSQETGGKRGYVFLAKGKENIQILSSTQELSRSIPDL